MKYEFLNSSINIGELILPNSDKINPYLLKNNYSDIIKAIEFIASEEKFLYVHGFMGTGKRQFINYISEFLNKDVIKLEYYCKEATVCDDILLHFNELINNNSISKAVNINAKITTLNFKFQQNISSIKKPFLIILHSLDDIIEDNLWLVKETLGAIAKEENVKIIVSTRAMKPDVLGVLEEDRKIFLKALTKENFKDFIISSGISVADKTVEDFYKYTRGYYYYLALTIKIIQAMNISLNEFLVKYSQSGLTFDSFLSTTYLNLIPTTIRNFFWFLRTVRHGLSFNALAVFELYDEFSIEYLKKNLMIFEANEVIYVQDYFLQKIDISIPDKTQIKLHKYIIGIYEKQLKESLQKRVLLFSRQALRAEIEYHNQCITEIESGVKSETENAVNDIKSNEVKIDTNTVGSMAQESLLLLLNNAQDCVNEKKFTEAIEMYKKILEIENIDLPSVVLARLALAKLYKQIGEYSSSSYFYELIETYYKQNKELINLNYLYYDMTDLLYKMYKVDRAIETIKKVIYSVDTPQSLLVDSCILLGNIYSDKNDSDEAYLYYEKAIESLDENVDKSVRTELYFKYALSLDDKGNSEKAFEYYDKCIALGGNSPYISFAYSNIASCYFENENYDEARACFKKAYDLDKKDNNYDGIYYNASHLAKIAVKFGSKNAYLYLTEAKKSAEFINDEFCILESTLALGDYYYNNSSKYKECLKEYFMARNQAVRVSYNVELVKIEKRINDMRLRMDKSDFEEVEAKYGK